jgi:hypothetical protein
LSFTNNFTQFSTLKTHNNPNFTKHFHTLLHNDSDANERTNKQTNKLNDWLTNELTN